MSNERPARGDGAPRNWMRQRLVAVVMGVVVLLIAVTIIAMSQTSGPLALSPAPTPTFQYPPAKATLFAREAETMSAARTANPNPIKPTYNPPTEGPTPTFTTGIFPALQDKFASFYGFNAYEGEINGRWEIVRPGTEWPTPVADYSAPGGYGAVQVYDAISHQLIGDYRAPDHSTSLVITSVKGNVLRLESDKTASLGFDMATYTFTN